MTNLNAPGLFEQTATATLARVEETFSTRGQEYSDTWRNNRHLALRAVYKKLTERELPIEICNALAAAAFFDAKYSRLEGRFKDDSFIDGIAYSAYLAEEVRRLEALHFHDSKL